MNHNRTTPLAIAAIVAATVLTALTLTIPQQAFAGGHHHHHNNIKVDQQINQLNECSGSPSEPRLVSPGLTVCLNQADNNADIDK